MVNMVVGNVAIRAVERETPFYFRLTIDATNATENSLLLLVSRDAFRLTRTQYFDAIWLACGELILA